MPDRFCRLGHIGANIKILPLFSTDNALTSERALELEQLCNFNQ